MRVEKLEISSNHYITLVPFRVFAPAARNRVTASPHADAEGTSGVSAEVDAGSVSATVVLTS